MSMNGYEAIFSNYPMHRRAGYKHLARGPMMRENFSIYLLIIRDPDFGKGIKKIKRIDSSMPMPFLFVLWALYLTDQASKVLSYHRRFMPCRCMACDDAR